jgi:hypothetical protein
MRKRSFNAACLAAILIILSMIGWKPAGLSFAGATSLPVKESAGIPVATGKALFEEYTAALYETAGLHAAKLDFDTFRKAFVGYLNLKKENLVAKPILTIVDLSRPSTEKRMWIVDLGNKKLLFNNLVAHGQGSGGNIASRFSNTADTHQSSLGFYITSQTYQGKHGLSLKLKGMDAGFNTNAESRAIVLHGAEYVSQSFIDLHGRLGRSFGCPAIPVMLTPKIIHLVKGQSCLFINGTDNHYDSAYLKENPVFFEFMGG